MEQEPEREDGGVDDLAGYRDHPRRFAGGDLVYPVLSRRSGGISVGVNLSPGKLCNFNCLYCQVDRSELTSGESGVKQSVIGARDFVERLGGELRGLLETVVSGRLYGYERFDEIPGSLRRLNDIALSGDGEPTASEHFVGACRVCGAVKDELGLDEVKIVLLTNASLLDEPRVQAGLAVLDEHQGEIWAKLDAGTQEYYEMINQTAIPLERVLGNIQGAARERAIVIQSLFVRVDGQRMSEAEVSAYADRLGEILAAGGQVSLVQLHTLARRPRDSRISSLSRGELDAIAEEITGKVTVPVAKYYAPGS